MILCTNSEVRSCKYPLGIRLKARGWRMAMRRSSTDASGRRRSSTDADTLTIDYLPVSFDINQESSLVNQTSGDKSAKPFTRPLTR